MKNIKSPYMSIIGWGMFLTGALMFASCADDDIIESTAVTTGDAICFSASKTRSIWEPDQTRSASSKEKQTLHCEAADGDFSVDVTVEDGIRSYESSQQVHSRGTQISEVGGWSYKVGAYYFFDESVQDESGTSIDFFSENSSGGLKINTDNNKNNAAVTTPYYWPPVGEMKFFAVAPAEVAEATEATFKIPALANVNTPTLTYTIPSNVAEQKDIMVAQSTVACQTNNSSVDLQFEHLLAAVHFKMGDMIATRINSITLSGIKGGKVDFKYQDGKWTPNNYGATSVSYGLTLGTQDQEGNWEEGKLANTLNLDDQADISGNDNNSMLLLAPQILSNATITVNYTELLVLKDGQPSTKEKTINLPEHTLEAGKTYAYTLTVNSGLNIIIPRPDDQDAHYVMVEMAYDLKGVSNDITDLTASIEYINNTASTNVKPTLLMKRDLTELQLAGYWTETQYTAVKNADGTTSYVNSKNIRGTETLKIKGEDKSGSLVIFLPENNGETDREVVLRISGKYQDTSLTIGSGSFKQYCPCWSEDGSIGVERLEERDANDIVKTHPWGFKYTRKAEYRFFSILNLFLPYVFEQQFGYEGNFYTIEKFSFLTIKYWSVKIDYTALNKITGANEKDGLVNTRDLFHHVGNDGGVSELEKFCQTYRSLIGDTFTLESEDGENDVPDDFAAYEALKRNKFVEILLENDGGSDILPMIFEEDIQWFLPSTTEALKLKETRLDSNGNKVESIDALQGTYWSSNRHVAQSDSETDDDTKAFSIKYTNGNCSIIPADRMTKYSVRAVRNK